MTTHPEGFNLANAIAVEILHWEDRNGMWWRGGSQTGLKVAEKRSDYPAQGYFRPDRNLFQLGLVRFKVETDTSARYRTSFPSGKLAVEFNGGGIRTTCKDNLSLGSFDNEVGALAAYLFIKEWRKENRT